MTMRNFFLIAALATAAASRAASADDAAPIPPPDFAAKRPAVRSGEPIFAFNGKDLTGFYPYTKPHGYADPAQVFTVRDGLLRISGEEYGGLATGGSFGDYQLIAEWRWGEATWGDRKTKARDSGILLHGSGPDGVAAGSWLESIECQLIEGGSGDFILVGGRTRPRLTCTARRDGDALYYDPGSPPIAADSGRFNWWGRDPAWADRLGFRGRRDVERPAGEWNRMEVICAGPTITVILNGSVVNVGTAASPAEGKIQFQSEGAEIVFRKIEVRPLLK